MLKELYIENLAIIEKANISFGDKLNIFSGETGAGKSILIGGINAILGGRVSKDIVRAGAVKAIVSGLFDEVPVGVKDKLVEYGFDSDDELMLQREIALDGKSTARINGRAVTVAVLKEIAENLINIHGQHDNQILLNSENQRDILDNYGNLGAMLDEYAQCFKDFSALSRQIKKLQNDNKIDNDKALFLREKIEDVKSFEFKKGEESEVESKLSALRNAEKIQKALYSAYSGISGADDESGSIQLLENARNSIGEICTFIPDCDDIKNRINSLVIELYDIESEISSYITEDEDESKQLTYYEERMSEILRVKRKYNCDLDELIDKLESWQEELYSLENHDDIIENLLEQRKEKGEKVKHLANEITLKRKQTAEILVAKVADELQFLDMPNVLLVFDISQDKVTVTGMDKVEMLISVNKGENPKPISKIASGGELSRIMLAIKNVLANNDEIPTMIFDEIDTGISGRAAHKVGVKLSEIAQKRQVLCVTHLAQIAAMADNHLLIEKKTENERTFTQVKTLDYEGRKREIARIISGDESDITLKSAEELLSRKH